MSQGGTASSDFLANSNYEEIQIPSPTKKNSNQDTFSTDAFAFLNAIRKFRIDTLIAR
jgi:hypothetical protein